MLIFLALILLNSQQTTPGYIETITISGCESCILHLTCRHFTSLIAVWEATFLPETNISNGHHLTPFPPIHPREALNRRCSGVNYCSFVLVEDCPGAETWGLGTLTIKYACISEDRIKAFCNSEIVLPVGDDDFSVSEGFIHNPGYPRFYASHRQCRWRITAPYQQQIKIKILDIALTGDKTTYPDECSDHLDIIESGQLIYSTCRPEEPSLEIVSKSDSIELALFAKHSLTPLRGVLIYYTAVGCPTPPNPEDGYLVYRNDNIAEFRCCVDFFFPDTGERGKVLNCLGAFWDTDLPLPDCLKKEISVPKEVRKETESFGMASDLVAPVLLIVALFLINFGVLFYIYRKKQRNCDRIEDEELGSLKRRSKNEQNAP